MGTSQNAVEKSVARMSEAQLPYSHIHDMAIHMKTTLNIDDTVMADLKREAARQGRTGRITFQLGDFVELAPRIPAADIVTLDRVVCCYARMELLVRLSAERSRRLYGLVYPRDRWLERAVVQVQNVFRALWGNPFRSFVHSVAAMDALIRSLGFTLRHKVRTFAWEVAVYQKETKLYVF